MQHDCPMTALPRGSTVRRDAGLYGYERALRRAGLSPVAGVDEAGRGACAGPLVAAAAILPEGKAGLVPGLADSKLLTAEGPRALLRAGPAPRAGLVGGGHRAGGVRPARHARRQRGGAAPVAGPAGSSGRRTCSPTGSPWTVSRCPGLAMWKGDRVAACISAASVIAKVTRDRIMCELHEQFPAYDFDLHKGYCTPEHEEALTEHGPVPRAPDAVRQRAACRRDHRPGTPQSGAPAGAVGPRPTPEPQEVLR